MYRSPLADLIHALKILAPEKTDHATRRAMARLLGLDWKHGADLPDASGAAGEPVAPGTTMKEPPPAPPPPPSPPPDVPPPPAVDPVRFRLIARPFGRRTTPDWLEQVAPFPVPPPASTGALLALEPLFRPDWARGILTGALASFRPDGPIDLARIIERICHGDAVLELPRVAWLTLARGVQLLVDQSEAMLPFRRDQKWLTAQLEGVLGAHAVEVWKFIGCPTRGMGHGPRVDWKPYREWAPPRTGATVVVVTDLGITSAALRHPKARTEEWLDFARSVRALACPIVALTPFAPGRVPAALHRVIRIIQWDRTTTASRVRSIVREGRR